MTVDRPVHTRRALLGAAAGLVAAAWTGACRSRSASTSTGDRLRVMMNGGIYEEHARRREEVVEDVDDHRAGMLARMP